MNPLLKGSDMTRDGKGLTQFYLPPTHESYQLPYLRREGWIEVSKKRWTRSENGSGSHVTFEYLIFWWALVVI